MVQRESHWRNKGHSNLVEKFLKKLTVTLCFVIIIKEQQSDFMTLVCMCVPMCVQEPGGGCTVVVE